MYSYSYFDVEIRNDRGMVGEWEAGEGEAKSLTVLLFHVFQSKNQSSP